MRGFSDISPAGTDGLVVVDNMLAFEFSSQFLWDFGRYDEKGLFFCIQLVWFPKSFFIRTFFVVVVFVSFCTLWVWDTRFLVMQSPPEVDQN